VRPRAGSADGRSSPAGALLKWWREARHLSQLALALEAGISARHLCFIETGRATPSREMLHKLSGVLDIPFRERNSLLLGAGYAPVFSEAEIDLSDPALAPIRQAIDAILEQQEPFPAVVMNRRWDVVKTNTAADRLFAFLLESEPNEGSAAEEPPNVLRLMFRMDGLRPYVRNWNLAAMALLRRLQREAVGGIVDESLQRLYDECLSYAGTDLDRTMLNYDRPLPLPVVPVIFEKGGRTFSYFSTVTTLGSPGDVWLQELRVESFHPLDAETRRQAEAMRAGESTRQSGP
jgi:transcriptional regulator with XRE-family HTH domain